MTALAPRWHTALLSAALATASLVFVAWAKMETVQLTYEIDRLLDQEDRLAEEQRRLRADLAALRAPVRLEEMAIVLGLQAPKTGQVVIVTSDPNGLKAVLDEPTEDPTKGPSATPGEAG